MPADAETLGERLSTNERKLLMAARDSKFNLLSALAERAGFSDENEAYSAASWLQKKGLVGLSEEGERKVRLGSEGRTFLEGGFPERRVYAFVQSKGGSAALGDLRKAFSENEVAIALAWWKRSGLGTIEKLGSDTVLHATPDASELAYERLLQNVDAGDWGIEAHVRHSDPKSYELLLSRPGVLETKDFSRRQLTLTETGRSVAANLRTAESGIVEITPELLRSGAWKGQPVRPYDISTEAPRVIAGKPHPLVQIIEEIRDILVQLGFQEISEQYVQSAFWNLDALFIPQDHPAREMQDTFYLDRPSTVEVPQGLVERISEVHKSGKGTGSKGWGQALDPAESRRALLRTHTTVGTIRYLAEHPHPPQRVFIIGRVFRKETMDATHLPEFHQIEGIATEEGADFPMLLGVLQEFYRRLGFPKLRWRPAYFPYTEPSMEVEVWTGTKWMELGGCGIFRPEVTRPLGIKTPVLAWGLGLERLAMMRLGLKDIRDLYISDLEWLRSQPLL